MNEQRYAVNGDIDMATAPELRDKLAVLINTTTDDIVLDCDGVEFLDSSGITVFMHTKRVLEAQGRVLRVENLTGKARRAIDLLGLGEVLGLSELDPA